MRGVRRLILLTLLPGLALAGCGGQPRRAAKAESAEKSGMAGMYENKAGGTQNAEMITCPVSGHTVPKGNSVVVKYQDREVRLCCADCVEPFQADPAKYMAALEKGQPVGLVPESEKPGH